MGLQKEQTISKSQKHLNLLLPHQRRQQQSHGSHSHKYQVGVQVGAGGGAEVAGHGRPKQCGKNHITGHTGIVHTVVLLAK